MGRANRLSAETGTSGVAVEYVRSRRILRLLGHCRGEQLPPVEIPVDRLCEELAIPPRDLGSPETFLLFAGERGAAGGGLRDLVGIFATEEQGRGAFAGLRVQHPAAGGWAELAAIDGFGRIRQLCWFGDQPIPAHPGGRSGEVPAIAETGRVLRRLVGVAGERRADDVSSF